jgi:hypothetical protein
VALRAALVDRARIVRREAAGPKVAGTTPMADVTGAWFRCRLELDASVEDTSEEGIGGGWRKARRAPTLMVDRIDEDGQAVEVRFTDRIEIQSGELGRGMWRATGNPAPIRKKRRILGWEVPLERVEEDRR